MLISVRRFVPPPTERVSKSCHGSWASTPWGTPSTWWRWWRRKSTPTSPSRCASTWRPTPRTSSWAKESAKRVRQHYGVNVCWRARIFPSFWAEFVTYCRFSGRGRGECHGELRVRPHRRHSAHRHGRRRPLLQLHQRHHQPARLQEQQVVS